MDLGLELNREWPPHHGLTAGDIPGPTSSLEGRSMAEIPVRDRFGDQASMGQ